MNLDDYREAMKEIPVAAKGLDGKLFERVEARKKAKDKLVTKKIMPIFALAAMIVLLLCTAWYKVSLDTPAIAVKVYAAEAEGIPLSENFVTIDEQVTPFYGGYTVDEQGKKQGATMTYHIRFTCEGEGIDTITYILSEKEVTRDNRENAQAYYVENITLPVDEYRQLKKDKMERFISGFYGEGEENATIINMIGSSYTVKYEEQENIAYGLVVAATVDEEDDYHCEDVVIRARIRMKNGSTVNKQFLLDFGDDAFHTVRVKILN
jgi:hypothetical protein